MSFHRKIKLPLELSTQTPISDSEKMPMKKFATSFERYGLSFSQESNKDYCKEVKK